MFTVPPQFVIVIGLSGVPLRFEKKRFLYTVAEFKQITAPGFRPSFVPSILYVFAGTTYVQLEQAGIVVRSALCDTVVLAVATSVVDVANISSSEHCWKKRHATSNNIEVFRTLTNFEFTIILHIFL
jgi:hypothetical protein